jgi:hypothetical protein
MSANQLILEAEQISFFKTNGWLVTNFLDENQRLDLQSWITEVSKWPDGGSWLHYREMTEFGPKLCRTEYFTAFHQGLHDLLTSGHMLATASALLGEQAVLYKEKINYKLAGGAGYSPHQDAPAYRFIDSHISCMVAVDDATIGNGCLEVVSGAHQEILPMDDDGCIQSEKVSEMKWQFAELKAGQTLWFHSKTPHRSGDNLSSVDRRAIYPTYNALSEGDLRERYYAQKIAEFNESKIDGTKIKVSLINDFRGKPVTND